MHILVIFFLTILVSCYGDESECVENAEICLADFLTGILDGSSEHKRCKELNKSIECLDKAFVESCVGEEVEDDVKEGIEALKEMENENCNDLNIISEDDVIQKCFEENEDYVLRCKFESIAEAYHALSGDFEYIENRLECRTHMLLAKCTISRIEEKCGPEAAGVVMRMTRDIPDGVKEACGSIGIALRFEALDGDKKKK